MKKTVLLILLILVSIPMFAQQKGALKGKLIDEITKEGVVGAVIQLAPVKTPDKKRFTTSAYKGDVSLAGLSYGEYDMMITFLGYDTIRRKVNVNKPEILLGTMVLKQISQKIESVVTTAQAIRTSQKGDTVIYSANAFKVSKDASAEGLLAKMPGVTVVGGKVEAQGEQVKKVYVDGKEFFGEDVTSAIKNLPAEMISKVQVYNKLSDRSEFTGIDDGEGYKAINIVTTTGTGSAQFGRIYAGYGFNDKYQAGANLSYFTGNHRVSFIGMSNNINQQNFSYEDILGTVSSGSGMSSRGGHMSRRDVGNFMIGSQDGVSKVNAYGLNYSGTWAKKLQVNASYFFNTTKNTNVEEVDRQYITDDQGVQRLYNATNNSSSRNNNHRVNAKFDYKINENNSLMMRPSISFQNNSSLADNLGFNNESNNGLISSLNKIVDKKNNDNTGYNISNSLLYRAKLGKPGRTITLDLRGTINKNDRTGLTSSERYATLSDSILRQNIFNNSNGYRIEGGATYTEPLTKLSQISLQYRYSYRYSDADKKSYKWLEEMQKFDPQFDPELSNVYNSGYTTHKIGPGYNYGNKKTSFSANISYQRSSLGNSQDIPIIEPATSKYSFDNVVYFAMLNKPFNATNTIRMFLRSYTENPSISQLQNVLDVSNLQYVTSGNPDLKPSYRHNLYTTYVRSSVVKGRTFMAMLSGNIETNSITNYTKMLLDKNEEYELPNGQMLGQFGQFSKPINMDGKWDVRGSLSFGTPITFIKSNFNVNAGVTYSESPSIINDVENVSRGTYYSAGASIGSNISEKIDFSISYSGGYNITDYKIKLGTSMSRNEYLTQAASLNFKFVFWKGFTFSGSTAYTQYKGVTDKFNEQYVNCNLFVGKKVFKNQRGEILFGVNDLFDQSVSFTRNITETYIENVKNNAIGRYFGIQFIYNLRNMKGKNVPDNDTAPSERRMMPGGMPPPGGGGRVPMH